MCTTLKPDAFPEAADPQAVHRASDLSNPAWFRVLGFRVLGFRVLGFRVLGF